MKKDMRPLRPRFWPPLVGSTLLLLANGAVWGQETIETLPPLRVLAPPELSQAPPKVVPITLDAVLRLAQDQNGQVRIARARLEEAAIKGVMANQRWLPNITVGPSFYRHEGGIQDFQGNLVRSSYGSLFGGVEVRGKVDWKDLTFHRVEAERQIIQRRGDLVKLTSEQLLEAAGAYIDLLSAKTAVALSAASEKQTVDVADLARKLAALDSGLRVEVLRVESELGSQRVLHRALQERAQSARLRLLYLLGLDPESELAFLDEITMVKWVNDQATPAQLVDQALRNGPGVAELTQLLAVVDRLHRESHSRSPLMPTLEVSLVEGAFGAGPGASTNWDNRFDLGVHLRWSLNDLVQKRDQQRLLDNQREQARLSFDELRGKLTLGVRQAFEEIKAGQDQMQLAVHHIQSAEESYQLSDSRLRQNIKGRSPSEVLLAARALFAARMSYLNAIRDYDKAQLRLFILVGAGEPPCR
jgi:multidrug efflux system outer membrane protein